MGSAAIRGGGRARRWGRREIKGIEATDTEFPMFGQPKIADYAQAEFARAAHTAAMEQLLALDTLATGEHGPIRIGLEFTFQQQRVGVGAVAETLVAEGRGGGQAAEIELLEVCG